MPQDIFRHRTEQQLAQSSPSMRAHDNQINVVFFKDGRQVLPDLSVPDVVAVRDVLQSAPQIWSSLSLASFCASS